MKEKQMTNLGIEMVDCFFCDKKDAVRFVNGRGSTVLGELKDRSEFGNHAHCGCLTNPNCKCPKDYHKMFKECRGY